MNRIRLLIMTFVGVITLAFMPAVLPGQINRTSLSGVITDPTGAVIPGAKVALEAIATGRTSETTTGQTGGYNFPALSLGGYTLTVSASGFKSFVRAGIRLYAGDDERLDVALVLGAMTEEVTVTESLPLLEISEPVYTSTVATETLQRLPISLSAGKRNATEFFTAIPGFQEGAGFTNRINGSIATYSELLIDGAPLESNPAVGGLFNNGFSIETVAEFTVSESPSADQGPTGGIVFSFVSKSGSNRLHGSVYEYHRNTALNSRDFFSPSVPKGIQNEFGFTVGGPVYLGDLYDGRDKSFFYFQWSGSKYRTGLAAQTFTMAPTAFKLGDFSSELALGAGVLGQDALGRDVIENTIYDPDTTRRVAAGEVDVGFTGMTNNSGAAATLRDPFNYGGNINAIDPLRFSTLSDTFQGYFPNPQTTARVNNYVTSGGAGVRDEPIWSLKVDQIIGNNRFAVFYWQGERTISSPFALPPIFKIRDSNLAKGHNSRLSWTRTFSPTVVNEFVFGVDRNWEGLATSGLAGMGASVIGQVNPLGGCTPTVVVPGFFASTQSSQITCGQGQFNTNFRVVNNLSYSRGKHLFKFGGSHIKWAANFPRERNARFNFLPAQTALPGAFLAQTGISYASFLLGGVDGSIASGPEDARPRMYIFGFYAQDNWRVTNKLTLELGLRWDLQPMPTFRNDAISQFDPTVPNPGAGGLLGALTFAGTGAGRLGRSRLQDSRFTDFGPRLGFAYQIQPKTVIRGNWGLYYGPVRQPRAGYGSIIQQGFFPNYGRESLDGFSAPFNWDQGFPLPPNPLAVDLRPEVVNGSDTGFFGIDAAHAPRIHQTHFSIQRELAGQTLLEVSFIGKYAHGILSSQDEQINQLDYAQFGSLGNLLTDLAVDPITGGLTPSALTAGITQIPFAGFQGSVAQALRPFPQYLAVVDQAASTGFSTYNSFQVKLQKHYANGVSFLVGYTIAKAMTDLDETPGFFAAGPQDARNRRAEKTVMFTDVPQQLLFNYLYELPFGPGKKFANGNNIFARHVIGGWALSGIHTYNAGKPLRVTTQRRLPTIPTRQSSLRPDRVPGVPARTNVSCSDYQPGQRILDINAFSNPAPFTFGNTSRNLGDVRGCGFFNENISIVKTFPIKESVQAVFGTNFFNVFNRHNWGKPAGDFDDPGSFGTITSTTPGRTIQFYLRIEW